MIFTKISDIRKEFGARVAKLVYYDSEDKRTEMSAEDSWKLRKQGTIDVLNEI